DPLFVDAFKDYGVDVAALDAATAAQRIRASAIRKHLEASLDDWLWIKLCKLHNYQFFRFQPETITRVKAPSAEEEHLRAVADLVSPDEWCRRTRDPEMHKSVQSLEELARGPEVGIRPSSAIFLARLLYLKGAAKKAVATLYAVQNQFPDDFVVNYSLAVALSVD